MHRLSLILALTSALLLAGVGATLLPDRVMAFEMEPAVATVPGNTTQFQDRDEKPLPAPLSSPKLGEEGESLQMVPETSSHSASFQLAPGTSLQITAGPEAGIEFGLQMAPTIDNGNPADNRALIPSP